MHVDLAAQVYTSCGVEIVNAGIYVAQVFSNTVGKALRFVVGDRAEATSAFILTLGDCLNVMSPTAG
jgi:hypothetical protein